MIHIGTRTPSSSTQSPSTAATYSSSWIPTMAQPPQKPWKNLGTVRMVAPLHPLPTDLEKWPTG